MAGLLVSSIPSFALDPAKALSQHVHNFYESRDGLPQNLTNGLAQLADGYLWAGSDEGLVRFDGAHFTVFDRYNTPGLSTNLIHALAVDGSGGLWVGTWGRGLAHFLDGKCRPVAQTDPRMGKIVARLLVDRQSALWVATRDAGVTRLVGESIVASFRAQDGMPSNDIESLFEDAKGNIWVGGFGGVVRLESGRVRAGPAQLAGLTISSIAQDRQGDMWFGTRSRGLAHLHEGQVEFLVHGLPSPDVLRLHSDQQGTLWVGTQLGLACVSGGRISAMNGPATIKSAVTGFLEDVEGSLWVSTEDGLHRLRDGDFVTYGVAEGIANDQIYAVLEDRAGTVWVGSEVGLTRLEGGRIETAKDEIRGRSSVLALFQDRAGDLWAGTSGRGFGRRRAGHWTWYDQFPETAWAQSIAEDGEGRLWLGTMRGLFRLKDGRVVPATGFPSGARVNILGVDGRGTLWVGTQVNGLWRMRGEKADLVPGGPPDGILANALKFDDDGTVWVGTEGNGLWRLRGSQWASFTRQDGLFDDVVWRILDDDRGYLWMTSNKGVFRVSRAQLEERASGRITRIESVAYSEADGLRSRECNAASPAGWRGVDGRLWFSTVKGVAVIDPAKLRPTPPSPATLVESAIIDGHESSQRGQLVIDPGATRIEIRYTGRTLIAPEQLRFRTRLEGFDSDWIDAGDTRVAHYTNLPPGAYRFLVQARQGAQPWGPSAVMSLRLRPRFHQTIWFYLLLGTVGALAIAVAHLLRVWQLRRRQRELQVQVDQALKEVKVLSGLLPICAWCKKIRDDQGYWRQIESYIGEHSTAEFSHGMCPECYERTRDSFKAD